jgi:hypothetical protein
MALNPVRARSSGAAHLAGHNDLARFADPDLNQHGAVG